MKFKLNCSPHLRMHEIIKKLFNRNFLSDIRFSVDGKIIYAHSLELMKRSAVFEKQLEDLMGEKKLIPIIDCKYDHFLEFVRYLYTDECIINDNNAIALLKLAIKYQVIMLENLLINSRNTYPWILQLFEHCVIEKYETVRHSTNDRVSFGFETLIKLEEFLSLQPDAVKEILGFAAIKGKVKEIEIFDALAGWIDNYCQQYQISLAEGRQRFDGLIKRIRFPTMSNDELQECVEKYPGLLSDDDCMSIGKQVLFRNENHNNLWISTQRRGYKYICKLHTINSDTTFETKFLVLKDTILNGFMIGVINNTKEIIEIEIAAIDNKTLESEKIVFTQSAASPLNSIFINLGDSIMLKPNFKYTITVKYLKTNNDQIIVILRKDNHPLVYNNPENAVQIIKASGNMFEMYFKSLPE